MGLWLPRRKPVGDRIIFVSHSPQDIRRTRVGDVLDELAAMSRLRTGLGDVIAHMISYDEN